MNFHSTFNANSHETGPPAVIKLTVQEYELCARVFDYPNIVSLGLNGEPEARGVLVERLDELALYAKEHDNDSRLLLALLAKYGLQEAQPVLDAL